MCHRQGLRCWSHVSGSLSTYTISGFFYCLASILHLSITIRIWCNARFLYFQYMAKRTEQPWFKIAASVGVNGTMSGFFDCLANILHLPLPSGYDVIRDFFISSIWHSALNSRDLKLRPQSVSMVSGGIISANPLSCLLMPLHKSWLADWARCTFLPIREMNTGRSHKCPLKLTELWNTSLLFDLNYKFINGSLAFSPG